MHENGGRPLAAVFASPGRYIQGTGAVGRIKGVLEGLGSTRPLILGDPIVDEIMGGALDGISGATRVGFGGENEMPAGHQDTVHFVECLRNVPYPHEDHLREHKIKLPVGEGEVLS